MASGSLFVKRSANVADVGGAPAVAGHALTPMHSPANWALLELVVERPSYAHALALENDAYLREDAGAA
jgi:hypothetical protein